MFVRYRKLKSGGCEPEGVTANIACVGRCQQRRARYKCPIKPRCRWHIGADEGLDLAPYRLQVSIVENRRVDGKVRQEHVADLGSVDGYMLPEFWVGIDPSIIVKIRSANWDQRSVLARSTFWETAKPRLDRLANRLDPKAIRMAVHARIPWPKQQEREVAEAQADFRLWQSLNEQTTKMIEGYERVIERAQKQNVELRQQAAKESMAAAEAVARMSRRG